MLEELINLKISMRKKEEKNIVRKKFFEYLKKYDDGERTIADKIRHREIFITYCAYMTRGGIE
jgi:hypothetical protein